MVIFFITSAWAETIIAKAARPSIGRVNLMLNDGKIEITAAAKRMLTEQEKRQVRETDMLAFERRYGKGVIDILVLGCQQKILLTIKGSHSSAQCNVRTNTNYNYRLMDDIDVLSGMPSLIRLSYLRICLNLLMPVPKACRCGTSTLCFECYGRPRVSAHCDIESRRGIIATLSHWMKNSE